MNCNYKVKLSDLQNKYRFKIFCVGSYDDSVLKKMIESVFYALPRVSGTGTSVTLEDTAFSYMKNKLYATNIYQETTTGKNLWGGFTEFSQTVREVTFTYKSDGSLVANGKATGGSAMSLTGTVSTDNGVYVTLSAGTYTVSGDTDTIPVRVCKGGDYLTTAENHTFTLTETSNVYLRVVVPENTEIDTTFYCQLETGSSATSYEQYTGGIPAPNPSYPVLVNTIKGNNTIVASNSDNILSNSVLLTLGDKEICKIGDYEDKIFKATKGNEIYDSLTSEEQAILDYGKWYLRKNTAKLILNGSEDWAYQYANGWNTTIENIKPVSDNNTQPFILCNYYEKGSANQVFQKNYGITQPSNTSKIIIKNIDLANATALKSWLSEHNTTVYYVLATPTNELFNDTIQDQLENIYNNMISYEETTNISQVNEGLPFNINATAIKDLNEL